MAGMSQARDIQKTLNLSIINNRVIFVCPFITLNELKLWSIKRTNCLEVSYNV